VGDDCDDVRCFADTGDDLGIEIEIGHEVIVAGLGREGEQGSRGAGEQGSRGAGERGRKGEG
ncbi:MAG: hypothetical protein DRJ65_06165, partial [Acidobacteria bacterium]